MNILVIGAMGRAGQLITQYAIEAGHRVTAFSRSVDRANFEHERLAYVRGDVLYPSLLEAAMAGHDAIIATVGVREYSGPITLLSQAMKSIVAAMKKQHIDRIVTIGGAGVLQQDEMRLRMEDPGFPSYLQNISQDHKRVYDTLHQSELDWTIVAPPFMPDGERTGEYLVRLDYLPPQARTEVSVQDVADFIVKNIAEPKYFGHRVGIGYAAPARSEEPLSATKTGI